MPQEDTFRLAGTVLEARYEIEAVIAEGGFGVVYRGRHIELQKPVALKVLKVRDTLSDKALAAIYEQFVNEARTVARLRHPNIVQAIDLGRSTLPNGAKAPWMALEWIDGVTLRDWFKARKGTPLSPNAALELLRPVFDALALAHDNNIAHRDIKPANIMVVEGAARRARQVLLMDFGIAKMMEEGEAAMGDDARTSSVCATYTQRYGAPEQAMGRRTGPWTDVHGMGLLMVEALTGATAYRNDREHPDGLMGLILANERPTPARFGVDVGAWEAVLAKALDRTPAQRYPNSGEFLAALETMLPGATAPSVGRTSHVEIRPPRGPVMPATVLDPRGAMPVVSEPTLLAAVTGNQIVVPPESMTQVPAGWNTGPAFEHATTAAPMVVSSHVPPPPSRRSPWGIVAAAMVGLAAAGAAIAVSMSSRHASAPAIHAATAPPVAAPIDRPAEIPQPAVPPVAPVVAAGPTPAVVSAGDTPRPGAPADPNRSGTHTHSSHRSSGPSHTAGGTGLDSQPHRVLIE